MAGKKKTPAAFCVQGVESIRKVSQKVKHVFAILAPDMGTICLNTPANILNITLFFIKCGFPKAIHLPSTSDFQRGHIFLVATIST